MTAAVDFLQRNSVILFWYPKSFCLEQMLDFFFPIFLSCLLLYLSSWSHWLHWTPRPIFSGWRISGVPAAPAPVLWARDAPRRKRNHPRACFPSESHCHVLPWCALSQNHSLYSVFYWLAVSWGEINPDTVTPSVANTDAILCVYTDFFLASLQLLVLFSDLTSYSYVSKWTFHTVSSAICVLVFTSVNPSSCEI